jgi:transcriptional regulator GlxA family with amidase domain
LIDMLALFDAQHTEGRVVVDRNRITGGGITAGLDFGVGHRTAPGDSMLAADLRSRSRSRSMSEARPAELREYPSSRSDHISNRILNPYLRYDGAS